MNNENQEVKNLLLLVGITLLVLFVWQLVHPPEVKKTDRSAVKTKIDYKPNEIKRTKEQKLLAEEERIFLENDEIKIGFNLQGMKIDFAELKKYKETTDENSQNVKILNSIHNANSSYFEFGWLNGSSEKTNDFLPNSQTKWHLNDKNDNNIMFAHDHNGIHYLIKFSLDRNFMLHVTQTIENNSDEDLELLEYARIQRNHDMNLPNYLIAHEGFIGTPEEKFTEKSYKKMNKKQNIIFEHKAKKDAASWLGITEKYWLQSLILPNHEDFHVHLKSKIPEQNQNNKKFYIDVTKDLFLEQNQKNSTNYKIFVGPKEISQINSYQKEHKIFMFDRAVDLGIFHLITKPIFILLRFINKIVHNFGIAIIILTTLIKLLMFPLAQKAHQSALAMQKIQPRIMQLKEKFKENPLELQRETVKLFKKNQVNPLAGLLPLLIQIPVFFSLYKVLFITIEMRHAPFFGWIRDLSASDPLYITNLFGIINFTPPSILAIGVFPVLLCITAIIQQKVTPNPMMNKPEHAILTKAMPFIFLFIFSSFPVGLVIYWVWNNILMIGQQILINKIN